MPQGKRKTPFSGKAKKEQLQLKKQSKNIHADSGNRANTSAFILKTPDESSNQNSLRSLRETVKVNYQPSSSRNTNRYALQFHRETDEEINKRKEQARHALKPISESALEIDTNTFFSEGLEFPKRPKWSYEQSVDGLNSAEHKYFTLKRVEKWAYLSFILTFNGNHVMQVYIDIFPDTLAQYSGQDLDVRTWLPLKVNMKDRYAHFSTRLNYMPKNEYTANIDKQFNSMELSYFELNLETWRQLWRVLEMSEIILLIVDIRFPALMFPPSLYDYITNTLKKQMILVLNKIDLASPSVVVAWKHYFQEKYPELHIVMFTTVPSYSLHGKQMDKAGLLIRRRKGRARMAAEATQQLLNTCKEIVSDQVDLSSWELKISEELKENMKDFNVVDDDDAKETEIIISKPDTTFYEHEKYKDGILTIGCIGQPNVGKSSLMNAVMGRKVVSVSRTPGHTKHFQTIYITNTVRFCDCPGLVFPSKVPKPLQVLMGSFPIAQLREPFSTVQFISERINLQKLLRIIHPENDNTWSAMDICDGWAKKNGFITAKAGRLDTHRAANSLLRMALDGKICLNLYPPHYFEKIEHWSSHSDIEVVKWIQALKEEPTVLENIKESDNEGDSEIEESDSSSSSGPTNEFQNKFSLLSSAND